jgi:hypothetical protein
VHYASITRTSDARLRIMVSYCARTDPLPECGERGRPSALTQLQPLVEPQPSQR